MGGAEKVMIRLANGFAGKNLKCSVVVLDDNGPLKSLLVPNVQIVNLNVDRARQGVKPFRKFLKSENPDVLIVSQTHIQIMTLLAVKWENWKGKVFLNEHSLFSFNNTKPLNKLLGKYLFGRADAVTAVSESVAADFADNFPLLRRKISVIHKAAFDPEIFSLKDVAIELDTTVPVVLTAGRLTSSKNYKLLLDAIAIVLKSVSVRLVFLGDGNSREELQNYAIRLGISSNVIFEGNVENPYSYMSRCKVFVMTSTYEGLPTVLIEALACGCNIVCTESAGGINEILLNGTLGQIVSPDAEALAMAIMKSLKSVSETSQKVLRAKEFGADIAVFKYLSLINHID